MMSLLPQNPLHQRVECPPAWAITENNNFLHFSYRS
jgi:hypothetical protein